MNNTLLTFSLISATLLGQAVPDTKPVSLEEELLALLNQPVQGASKRAQKSVDSPQAIEVITGAELRQMGITRLQDALRLMTSVNLIESGTGATSLGMRGVMQDGQPRTVQILIDGAPMYNVLAGGVDIDNLPVPVDLIERIEVVRGPSSTLYGADAVVGVISIITRKPEEGLHGDLRASGANLGTYRGGAALQFGSNAFSATGGYDGASTQTSNETVPVLGDPAAAPTIYNQNHPDATHQDKYFARADAKVGDAGFWAAAGSGHKLMGGEKGFDYRATDMNYLQAGWHEAWSSDFTTEVRVHRVDQSMTLAPYPAMAFAFGDPGFNGDYKFFDTRTTLLEVQGNWTATQDLHLVFGADQKTGQAFGPATFIGLTQATTTDKESGGFLSVDWDLTSTLALSAGARAENETLGGSRVSPRLALVWKAGGDRIFRAAFLTSTRSPQIAETQAAFQNATGMTTTVPGLGTLPVLYQFLPDPTLRPEKTLDYELGYRDRLGAVSLDLTLYRMTLKNLIYQATLPTTVNADFTAVVLLNQFQNGGNATNQGFEATVNWLVATGWNLGANGTLLNFTRETADPTNPLDGGKGFSYAPKFTGNVFTKFRQGRWSGSLAEQYVGATDVEALQVEGSPYYATRAAYFQTQGNVGCEVAPGLTLTLYVLNGNRPFQPQGSTGVDRPDNYYSARREAGAMVRFLF